MREAGQLQADASGMSSGDGSGVSLSSDEQILPRVLPDRQGRGKRARELEGSDAEYDQEFWEQEKWKEDDNDAEWSTENEQAYKDVFDSDFFQSTSSDSDDNDDEQAKQDTELAVDGQKRKKFDYEKIAAQRIRRARNATKIWSIKDPNHPLRGKRPPGSGKCYSQALLLSEAEKTEKMNTQVLHAYEETLRAQQHQDNSGSQHESKLSGNIECFFSWSSDRKIAVEEAKKSLDQKQREANLPSYERQLLLFLNLTKPQESRLPILHNQQKSTYPAAGKYKDPLTLELFDSPSQFRLLRSGAQRAQLARICAAASKDLARLSRIS